MERPPKRPCLALFRAPSPEEDLDRARHNNDMYLKKRWETIFDKYSRDFTDIGDEIDLMNGQIVVNRGHIENMETETDEDGSSGRSLLQIISAAQINGGHYPGFDGIVESIETLTNAPTDNVVPYDGEGGKQRTSMESAESTNIEPVQSELQHTCSLQPYDSGADSLFEEGADSRSASPDSLFGDVCYNDAVLDIGVPSSTEDTIATTDTAYLDEHTDHEILTKFGVDVGQEVLGLIRQRQQAHIEPAWRVPLQINSLNVKRPAPRSPSLIVNTVEHDDEDGRSLWRPSRPSRVSSRRQDGREESEDPLQEDFDDRNIAFRGGNVRPASGSLAEPRSSESSLDEEAQSTLSGRCTYCHRKFGTRSGLMAHWDRWLRKHMEAQDESDPHDLEAMQSVRAAAVRRVRPQRLTVGDFKLMVELHEGADMTFAEIANTKLLRTRKEGPQLQTIYDRHRTSIQTREDFSSDMVWSAEMDNKLITLSQNKLHTMSTLRRALKVRDEIEIGDRLAEIWLAGFAQDVEPTNMLNDYGVSNVEKSSGVPETGAIAASQLPAIKQEEN